jgi:DNA-directed RNA polymerase subunit RPC12/RpoP
MTASLRKNRIYAGLILIAYVLLATFILYLAGNSSLYAQDADIYIKSPASDHGNSRPAVYFTHEDHTDSYDCLECHHDYRNGKNVLDEDDLENGESASCASCHTKDASIDLETAYHRLCMGCHRRVNKQEAAALPITCQDCHSRPSPAP